MFRSWISLGLGSLFLSGTLSQCPTPEDPEHGTWRCEIGQCFLKCFVGYIASGPNVIQCQDSVGPSAPEAWNMSNRHFECVRPIALVVGGVKYRFQYEVNVEIVAPELAPTCRATKVANFPVQIISPVGGFVNGYLMVCGGAKFRGIDCWRDPASRSEWCTGDKTASCYKYLTGSNRWERMATSLPTARMEAMALVNGSSLVVLGGVGPQGQPLKSVDIFDYLSETWTRGTDLPNPLFGSCGTVLASGTLEVVGGFSMGQYTKEALQLAWTDGVWTSKAYSNLIEGRQDHGCVETTLDGTDTWLVAGGRNEGGILSTVEALDIANNKFVAFNPKLSQPRNSAGILNLNGKPTLMGGVVCTELGCLRTNSVVQFDIEVGQWVETAPMAQNRSSHSVFAVPASLFTECTLG